MPICQSTFDGLFSFLLFQLLCDICRLQWELSEFENEISESLENFKKLVSIFSFADFRESVLLFSKLLCLHHPGAT